MGFRVWGLGCTDKGTSKGSCGFRPLGFVGLGFRESLTCPEFEGTKGSAVGIRRDYSTPERMLYY